MPPTIEELQQAAEEAIAAAEAATAQARTATSCAEEADQRLAEYENAEQAQLHAQAIAVINIKLMIPLVLEQTSTFYSRWRSLFLNTVSKYALDCLMLTNDDFSTDPHWHRMDCTVKSPFGSGLKSSSSATKKLMPSFLMLNFGPLFKGIFLSPTIATR
jgi:hypothetical protein